MWLSTVRSYIIIIFKNLPPFISLLVETARIILFMCPANERWCYNVTSSLIGWVHTQNNPWNHDNNFGCSTHCDPVMQQTSWSTLVQVMAGHLSGTQILHEPMLTSSQLDTGENFSEILIKIKTFSMKKDSFENLVCKMLAILLWSLCVNPLRAKFFRGNIDIYLHFVSFLHLYRTQVVEILPQIRQEPTYSTQSISWLLMSWRRKEPGYQQSWYWPSQTEITRSPHIKG